jgi:hypothetical protein
VAQALKGVVVTRALRPFPVSKTGFGGTSSVFSKPSSGWFHHTINTDGVEKEKREIRAPGIGFGREDVHFGRIPGFCSIGRGVGGDF